MATVFFEFLPCDVSLEFKRFKLDFCFFEIFHFYYSDVDVNEKNIVCLLLFINIQFY